MAVEQINHTAMRKLYWRTPYEMHWGETPDISVFRFLFYEPIYYLDPMAKFPNANMIPGRFLGIARTSGDAFTFYIEAKSPKGRHVILTRSVIQRREPTQLAPFAVYEDMDLEEAEQGEITPDEDTVMAPPQGEEVGEQAEKHGDPFDEEPNLKEILADLDSEEVILGDEVATYAGTDENGDVILHMEDGSSRTMPTADVINHLTREQDAKEVEMITGHHWAPMTGKLLVKVRWYTSEESLLDEDLVKEAQPMMLA